MTPKQELLRKSLIKQLHISKRYKEYYKDNRDEYKELLREHFGKESSTKLTIEQLIDLVEYMNFKKDELRLYSEHLITTAQKRYIKELWATYATNTSERALLGFIYRQTHKRYLHLHIITRSEAQKIIPVLKKMNK